MTGRRASFRGVYGLVVAAALVFATAAAPVPTPLEVVETVNAHAHWRAEAPACPVDAMARVEVTALPQDAFCATSTNPETCLKRCENGTGPACYWLAIRLQEAEQDEGAVNALFMRSCQLGVASGCTNVAAARLDEDADSPGAACVLHTFERSCELDDPWGCTMFAFELSRKSTTEADLKRALQALEKSCLGGEDDPACTAGRDLAARLQR